MELEPSEVQVPQFGWEVLINPDQNLVFRVQPLKQAELPVTAQHYHQLKIMAVVVLQQCALDDVLTLLLKINPEAFGNPGLEILELVEQQVMGKEGEVLGGSAKAGGDDPGEPFEVDVIDSIKIIVQIVSDLSNSVVIDYHEVPHLLVIKICHWILEQDPLAVKFVLTVILLTLRVDLVEIATLVNDEGGVGLTQEEAGVFL